MSDDIQAFPMPASEHSQGGHFEQHGMSLRDYFAAAALAGVLVVCRDDHADSGESRPDLFARIAYELADAMLRHRSKPNE